MKYEIKFKQYILDKSIELIIMLGIMLFFAFEGKNNIVMYIIIIIIAICEWYLCKEVILLPIDLVAGTKNRIVFFSRVCNIDNYEFYKEKYYCEWKLYSSEGTINVLIPVCLSKEELKLMEKPKTDQKIKITYYSYSKILKSWEALS